MSTENENCGSGLISSGSGFTEPCEIAERPIESVSNGKYPITIHYLDYGYNVKIGCQNFAVETPETLIKNLEAYLNDPSGTERKWMKERKLL